MLRSSRHIVSRLFWLLLLILLSSCGRTVETTLPATAIGPGATASDTAVHPTIPSSLTALPPARKDAPALRWLAGIPCQAPCWEQIIPGTTTITDATIRLSQLDSITSPQQMRQYNNDPAMLTWHWKQYSTGGGSVYYYTKKPAFTNPPLNIVLNISLALDQPLTLQDIIARYGEPSHIHLAADYHPSLGLVYYFSVVYLDDGFLLQTQTNDFSRKPTLRESTTFGYVEMFEPSAQGFDVAIEPSFPVRQPSQFLVAWQGFDTDINSYCRDIRPNAPEKGCE